MKKLIGVLSIGCLGIFAACNSSSTSEDSVENAKEANDSTLPDSNSTAMASAPASKEDADWVVEVANAGMTEVELSKIAQTKATDPRLKSFADMMVNDHSAANDKLKQLAGSKSIDLPVTLSDDSKKELDELNNKKAGKDFDKAYMDDMLDGHRKAVDKFEKGSTDLQDADLKNFAATTLPTLKMHQDSIKAIAGKK